MDTETDTVALRVEYRYDSESRNRSFVVPLLGIVGGADTREEAEREAVAAIAFTLESDSTSPPPSGGDIGYVRVKLAL
ncbi:MAG: hypothetical protein ACRDJE_20970 [Dehalococcoidia bacterium]